MINLLWFFVDKFGCGTFRVYIPAYALETMVPKQYSSMFIWQEECTSRKFYIGDLQDADIAIFQRPVGSVYMQALQDCKDYGVKSIIEMDDNLFDIPRHNPAAWLWRKKAMMKQYKAMLEMADAVTVSTVPLRDVVQREMNWQTADKIHLCMNHLNPVAWDQTVLDSVPKHPKPEGQVIIGWQGSTTHEVDFKQALPALRQVLEDRPNVKIRLFGDVPKSVRNMIPVERFEWTAGVPYELYPRKLSFCNFDIGIAPITPSNFNMCKSNIKWLEYSVLRVPTVASRVYPYERSIEQGLTGLLCSNDKEWYDSLIALVDNPELRMQMGVAANKEVWSNWSNKTHASSWDQTFKSLVAQKVSG